MAQIKLKKYPEKILIIKPSSLGDVVHSLPFLNSIKSCYPKAEMHWVIAKGLEEMLEGHPMVDKLIIINKDMWKKLSKTGETVQELRRLFRGLKDEGYDLVVDLQGLLRSGVIAMSTGAPVRVGFEEAREGSRLFYTERIRGGKDVHAVDRYLKIAEALGCETEEILFPFPLLKENAGIKTEIKDYIVIVPGARWDTKIWPAESFGRLASMLPLKSVVVGGRAEMPRAEKVVELSRGRAVSLAGKTSLRELIEVMRGARLVISNDSGPMHIAAAFKIPVVAIFGPTSPVRTGPYGQRHIIIQTTEKCSPCYRKRCATTVCMKRIEASEVYERMRPLLDSLSAA